MNDLEHQFMFDKVVSSAAEIANASGMPLDKATETATKVLISWWTSDLAHNLNKRGVIAELSKSVAHEITKK